MSGARARSVLRRLIRAKRVAFANDAEMLGTGRQMIREQFEANRGAAGEEVGRMLREAEEAIEFLASNVVQAPLNEKGNYVVDATRIDESKR